MYIKYFKTKDGIDIKTNPKNGGKLILGRKSKYSLVETKVNKKTWSVALYIRLSQEDEDNRNR